MSEHSDHFDHPPPEWAEDLDLIAFAVDLVSYRRYHVWFDREEAVRPAPRLRRAKRRPLLVEDVQTGLVLVRLEDWDDVLEWHDREVISSGWTMLREFPEPEAEPAAEPVPRPSSPPSRV